LVLRDSEWDRGSAAGELYSPGDETYCCLGIFGRDFAKLKKSALMHGSWPHELSESSYKKYKKACPKMSKSIEREIALVNDDYLINDDERVKQLQKLWNKLGYKVEFRANE
jgi:hypothetical protein